MVEDTVSGYLELQNESSSEWQRMYCVLKNLQLQCYDAEAENFSHPEITIPVTKVSEERSKLILHRHILGFAVGSSNTGNMS